MRFYRVLTVFASLWLSGALSGADLPRASSNSDDLINWVRKTGKTSVMRAAVAELLNLGKRPIALRERAFAFGEQIHLLGTPSESESNKRFIFIIRLSDADDTAMIWHGAESGKLLTALFVDPSQGIIRLRVEEQLGEFLAEKEFFRRKMREMLKL